MKYLAFLITVSSSFTVHSFSPPLLQRKYKGIIHSDYSGGFSDYVPHHQLWQSKGVRHRRRSIEGNLFSRSSMSRACTSGRLARLKTRWLICIRRFFMIIFVASVLWSGAFGKPPTSNAVVATQIFHEKVVDNYVKNHMFDNEEYDAVSSTYREANLDNNVGAHATALREITMSIVGESGKLIGRQTERGGNPVASLLMTLVSFLEKKGMSQMSSIILLTTIVFTVAPAGFLVGSMAISLMFKRGITREMKARYGNSYTIDATIKKDEDIQAPDDEDDDDDDEDDGNSTTDKKD